jgi:elongation factor G
MSTESKSKTTNVHAEVPLSEMFGYVNNIRSMSKGRASYTMEPSHFEQVPGADRRADHRTEEG